MAGFVQARDRAALFRVEPLQSDLGRRVLQDVGRESSNPDTVIVVTDFDSRDRNPIERSAAVLFVLGGLGWPWKMALPLRILPSSWLDWIYDLVARNRSRLFGRRDSCALPAEPRPHTNEPE
jgi:predicted DCC family thiol-disulfide oxidoreductase YuxK